MNDERTLSCHPLCRNTPTQAGARWYLFVVKTAILEVTRLFLLPSDCAAPVTAADGAPLALTAATAASTAVTAAATAAARCFWVVIRFQAELASREAPNNNMGSGPSVYLRFECDVSPVALRHAMSSQPAVMHACNFSSSAGDAPFARTNNSSRR